MPWEPPVKHRHCFDEIELIEYEPDFESLERDMVRRLGATEETPHELIYLADVARIFLKAHPEMGTQYLNPRFTIRAVGPTDTFFTLVRWARAIWIKQLRDAVPGSGYSFFDLPRLRRPKREIKIAKSVLRRLRISGVLIVQNSHVPTGKVPRPRHDGGRRPSLIGQSFGRLIVTEMLPGGDCRCRCRCGRETTARRQHLLSGRRRSCGCRHGEIQARQKAMKECRMLRYNNGLDFLRAAVASTTSTDSPNESK